MKKPATSEGIANRFIELSEKGQLYMGDEIRILQHLVNKMNLISASEYAKLNGISRSGVRHRIKKEPTVLVGGLHYFVK